MTTYQAMERLYQLGYEFAQSESGRVTASLPGALKAPAEADALFAIARQDHEGVAAFVQLKAEGHTVVEVWPSQTRGEDSGEAAPQTRSPKPKGIWAEAGDGSAISLLDALALSKAVKEGTAQLLGKVVFHRRTGAITLRWHPTGQESPSALLTRYRQRLHDALQAKIAAMDASEYWKLTAEEYERFCARYGQYCRILEGYGINPATNERRNRE